MPALPEISCLVTGSAGFVGSHLVQELLRCGFGVVGVDNFFSGKIENMQAFMDHPLFSFFERSVAGKDLIAEIMTTHPSLQHCFHLAAIASVPYSLTHESETLAVNYHATTVLLKDAERMGFSSFVFAGSAAEYGDETRLPIREEYADERTVQLSPYGRAKYLASHAVATNPIGVSLRFFNIYGPGQDPDNQYSGVISRFLHQASQNLPIIVHGDGSQTRDFIYISDAVQAYLAAAGLDCREKKPSAGCYNIGTGKGTSILKLAQIISDAHGNLQPIEFGPARPGDILYSLADSNKFTTMTQWLPRITIHKGIALISDALPRPQSMQQMNRERRRESFHD